MYGFYEIAGITKSRAFNGAIFDTITDALESVATITVYAEQDEAHDAADVFTKFGQAFSIERVA
jgi:hypothetical protein